MVGGGDLLDDDLLILLLYLHKALLVLLPALLCLVVAARLIGGQETSLGEGYFPSGTGARCPLFDSRSVLRELRGVVDVLLGLFRVVRLRLQPIVLEELGSRGPLVRVNNQHLVKQLFGISADMIRRRELPSADLLVQFLIRLSFEGKMPAQERIQ